MRTLTQSVRTFARQLMRDFPEAYERDHSKFRKRAGSILTKSIPGSRPGPKLIPEVTEAIKLYEQSKLRCHQQNVPFDPRKIWKEIRAVLHVPDSERNLIRDRARARRHMERRRNG